MKCLRFSLLVCLLGVLGFSPLRAEMALAPYHGDYLLELRHSAASSGGVAALKGHLEVRVERSCDGWSTRQSMGFRMIGEDGSDFEHLAHLVAFEEDDNSGFTFSSQTWEDRQVAEHVAGVASRDTGDGVLAVRWSKPEVARQRMPRQTVFPGEHARQVVAAAIAGKRALMHTVFDGSSRDNPLQVSTLIGQRQPPRADDVGALAQHSSWPLRLAYFSLDTTEPLALFEMSLLLYDNGVAGDMIYDYGDFEVNVTLKNITLLPVAKCR